MSAIPAVGTPTPRKPVTTTVPPGFTPPGRRRLLSFGGEIVLATVTAVGVSLLIQLVVSRLPVPPPVISNVALALNTLGAACVVAMLLLLLTRGLRGRWRRAAIPLTWAALSALATLPLSFMLLGTRHYLNGISGDQSFRVQYLTRFVDSAHLADMAYPDLPPYYPAGWFWLGGRAAALAGVSGWEAYKPFAIATMALAGVLAFCVWSLVVTRARAAALALVTAIVGLRIAAYTPYSWLVIAMVPALAVLGLRIARSAAAGVGSRQWAGSAVVVGLALGTAGAVHSLVFWFAGLLLVVLASWVVIVAPYARRSVTAARLAGPALLVGGVALPVVLLVWAPYLLMLLERGSRSGAAQRFLPESSALLPLPMVEFSVTGTLALAGTVWVVARFRSSDVAQALGLTILVGYGWYALSTLALSAGTTLLPFRLAPLIGATLASGGALGVVDGLRIASERLRAGPSLPLATGAAVLSFASALTLVQSVPGGYEWSRAAQFGDYYPTGQKPVGPADDTEPGAWNDELIATIDQLTGMPPRDVVVLSTHSPILTYRPYHAFQAISDHYANPLGEFPARRAQIKQWAASPTPEALLAALDASARRPPSVFVLSHRPEGLRLAISYDVFPEQPNIRFDGVIFDPGLFDHPAFERREVGPFTVVVRMDG